MHWRRRAPARDRGEGRRRTPPLGTVAIWVAAALGAIALYQGPHALLSAPYVPSRVRPIPFAAPTRHAFGLSGAVHVAFALPGGPVPYPLEVRGDPAALHYQWVRLHDRSPADSALPLVGDTLRAPDAPGFYRLELVRGDDRREIDQLTLSVLVPFSLKRGATLDGYRLGIFPFERHSRAADDTLMGLVRVMPADADLPISQHLRLADFLTHDGQTTWPRFAAVRRTVVDKLELVLETLAAERGDTARVHVEVEVHSGFRSPAYNHSNRFAPDSRHQYGDAVDVAIDADGDGRITARDVRLVSQAVDRVEDAHPELAGGMGVYTSAKYAHPYVHIDTRGERVRWRG
ncbi:MAG TPA: D-Ala-D-Ala carboxypeptidase family metallohydrolase [Gemmatimonadaceae bacterium]|nr:D-Ala-D-Ala carboxypeptidase family metallohydrolase [Gemmatimonadaceae bacterium]